MKNLITSIACVILLMAFVVQFAHNQSLYHQIAGISHLVQTFEEQIQTDGVIDKKNQKWLCKQISMILACEEEMVTVKDIGNGAEYGERIQYEVEFPIANLLAVPEFWGIETGDNHDIYTISGDVISKAEKHGESR